jgi:hypothetical protein
MKKALWILVLVGLLGSACVMAHHRSHIREGILEYNMHSGAFTKEWGQPDRITSTTSPDFINFPSSGQFREYTPDRVPLEVWIYSKYGVALVFKRVRLVAWKTDKTPADLKAPSNKED